jgi:hypothetical protein
MATAPTFSLQKTVTRQKCWYNEEYIPEADGEAPEVTGISFAIGKSPWICRTLGKDALTYAHWRPVDQDVCATWLEKD